MNRCARALFGAPGGAELRQFEQVLGKDPRLPATLRTTTGTRVVQWTLVADRQTNRTVATGIEVVEPLPWRSEPHLRGFLDGAQDDDREIDRTYRRIVENAPVVFITFDETGETRFTSSSMERLTGYPSAETPAISIGFWRALIHPDDRERFLDAFAQLFAGGEPFEIEYRWRHRDGRWIWTSTRLGRPYLQDGVRLADGVSVDITQIKRGEEQERAVADFGFHALTEHDLDGLMREACHVVRAATGCDASVILRRNGPGFEFAAATGMTASGIASAAEAWSRLAVASETPIMIGDLDEETRFDADPLRRAGIASGVSVLIDSPWSPYGTLNVVSTRAHAFTERDAVFIRAIATFLGAAMARRAAEDESTRARRDYQRLVEIAQEGVVVFDSAGTITFANQKAAEIMGYPLPMLIGLTGSDIVPEEDQHLARAEKVRRDQGLASNYDMRLRRRDGTLIWTSVAASPLTNDAGQVDSTVAMISDITDRVRAEEDLRWRELLLREAQTVADVGSFEFAIESNVVSWSDELYRIAGLQPQSRAIDLPFLRTLVPPDEWPALEEAMIALIVNGTALARDHVSLRADGARRFVRSRARVLVDPRNGQRSVIGTVQDITEEAQAQRAILERETRLHLLVSNLPVVLWSTDLSLRITSLAGAGMLSNTSWWDTNLGLGSLLGDGETTHDLSQVTEGKTVTFETRIHARDLRVHAEPLRDIAGQIVGTVGIAFDVSEQKASERANLELLTIVERAAHEWSETFDSIASPIVLLDANGTIERLNAAALVLAGSANYRDIIGHAVTAGRESPIWKELAAAAEEARTRRHAVVQRAYSGERHWDVMASPWSTGERTTVVATEVTAIANMQEKLHRSERLSAVGALVSGVAHEVRNPLFGISATIDAFEATFEDAQFTRYTVALRENVARLNELMKDLLEYGRPSQPTLTAGPLAPVVLRAHSAMGALATQANVTIDIQLANTLPPVRRDASRVQQVFENLFKNAIQHSDGESTVEVRGRFDHARKAVVITVEDRGSGFREEDLPRLFEPFFTRRHGGTGLGLSLVQRILEDHGATIDVRNRDGGGASVTVGFQALEVTG